MAKPDSLLKKWDGQIVKDLEAPNGSWEPPVPLEYGHLPFPIDALPNEVRDWVTAEAEATQTPVDLAAMLAISVCSAAVAQKFEVRPRLGWIEPVNLHTLTILESGHRKCAVLGDATEPLREFERQEMKRVEPMGRRVQFLRMSGQRQIERRRSEAAKSEDRAEQDRLRREATRLEQKLLDLRELGRPRLITVPYTSANVRMLLAEPGERITCWSAEGGLFDWLPGQYNPPIAPLAVYLFGPSGDELGFGRVSRQVVSPGAVSMGLAVHPEMLRGLLHKSAVPGRGLLARFLYSVPESLLGRRKIDPPPVPQATRDNYRDLILSLCLMPFRTETIGNPAFRILELSDEAKERLRDFEMRVEPQLGMGGDMELVKDWGGNLAGAVVRLAGIFHVVEQARDGAPWQSSIAGKTMRHAIRVGEYLIPHANAALELMGASQHSQDAKYLLRWVKQRDGEPFTESSLHQSVRGRFKARQDLEAALKLLTEHNIICKKPPEDRVGPGRPRSTSYEVNPAVMDSFSARSGIHGPGGNFQDFQDGFLQTEDKTGSQPYQSGNSEPENPHHPTNQNATGNFGEYLGTGSSENSNEPNAIDSE